MKKIAFLIPGYIGGGAEHVTDVVASGLHNLFGWDIMLISARFTDKSKEHATQVGYEIEKLSFSEGHYYSDEITDKITDIVRRTGVDILVIAVDMIKDPDRIKKAVPGCKIIYHHHGMPLWEVSSKLIGGRRNAEKSGSRCKMAKWWISKYAKEKYFGVYTRRFAKRYRNIYRQVDGYIVLCDAYRHQIEQLTHATSKNSRVTAMYNPIDTNTVAKDQKHGKTVLFVGRLSYSDKRVDRLLRIWAMVAPQHPGWTLKIVGDGPERANLEALASQLGITSSVQFCGYSANTAPYYSEASILCLTSEFEGWGMVIAEAQANGVWPIAFNVSAGVEELIGTDATRGTLVKPYSEKAYASALSDLMADTARLDAMRPAMIASTARYTPTAIATAWHRYLTSL